jgi:hypothetical protein
VAAVANMILVAGKMEVTGSGGDPTDLIRILTFRLTALPASMMRHVRAKPLLSAVIYAPPGISRLCFRPGS